MAQYLFDRRLERRALQQNHRCFALIRFLGVVPTLHTKFWQPAGHGPKPARPAHLRRPLDIFSQIPEDLPQLPSPGAARVSFYRREMRGASAALEQEKGEATSGDQLPPVLET